MDPKVKKAAPAAKTTKKGGKTRKRIGRRHKKFSNFLLTDGVRCISRGKQVRLRKAVLKKKEKPAVKGRDKPEKKFAKPKPKQFIIKKIGGAKNGGERKVFLKKSKRQYPTKPYVKKRGPKTFFHNHKRHYRKSLQIGTVLILVAGRHKGKRVVLLKKLSTGLLLVTGPFALNSCPMRRISQNYVIATKTRLDLSKVKVPKHINDRYFRRVVEKKKKSHDERDIFAKKEFKYTPSEQRKTDQKLVDAQLLKVIREHKEYASLKKYLTSSFCLRSNQFPHRMNF